jgi:hypothetical protein
MRGRGDDLTKDAMIAISLASALNPLAAPRA